MARRKRKKNSRTRRIRKYVLLVILALMFASVALTLPLRWFDPVTTSFMLRDDSGRIPVLHEWHEWDRQGAYLPLAVIAAEDQRFDRHFGLDLESINKSIAKAKHGGSLRGASTITQQLAKNLFLWSGRSFVRKGFEAWLAFNLELFLPKRRILEIYLNVIELGPGIYGTAAGSRYFFGKAPTALSAREAALLAAVLPNPHQFMVDAPSAYVRERQAWILGQMKRLERERWIVTIDP